MGKSISKYDDIRLVQIHSKGEISQIPKKYTKKGSYNLTLWELEMLLKDFETEAQDISESQNFVYELTGETKNGKKDDFQLRREYTELPENNADKTIYEAKWDIRTKNAILDANQEWEDKRIDELMEREEELAKLYKIVQTYYNERKYKESWELEDKIHYYFLNDFSERSIAKSLKISIYRVIKEAYSLF